MPADALRKWHVAGKWEQAVRLAEGPNRTDLEWLVELESLIRRASYRSAQAAWPASARPAPDPAERLSRSGKIAVRRDATADHPAGARTQAAARCRRGRCRGEQCGSGEVALQWATQT